jgi:hypothetical protein
MTKTNKTNRTVYGVSYLNHGSWTTPTAKSVFSKTAVKQLSGLSRTSNMNAHLEAFTSFASYARKQPARILKMMA